MSSGNPDPFADENAELDYGEYGKDVKLNPLPQNPEPDKTQPALSVNYQDLEFELRAPRQVDAKGKEGEKRLLTYDKSLERLNAAGYKRHPRPQEAFGLLIAGLEAILQPEEKAVADDMMNSYGEWLSVAMERNGDKLTVYLDHEGLVWNGSKYEKNSDFKASSTKTFDVSGKESNKRLSAELFDDDFVTELYGRSFAQLPEVMRTTRKAHIALPADGSIWPVSRGVFSSDYDVSGDISCNVRASRGVRPAQKIEGAA